MWLGFAIISGALFRRIFPELRLYGNLAACLILAPVVVETQLSAIVTGITVNLFTIASYAAILILLEGRQRENQRQSVLVPAAFVLAAFASFSSEYAVAANFAGVVLLVGLAVMERNTDEKRTLLIRGGMLLAVTVSAYALFWKTIDFSARPDVNPVFMIRSESARLAAQMLNGLSGIWYSLVAAYASALGGISLSWSSKASIAGPALGVVIGILLWLGARSQNAHTLELRLHNAAANPAAALRLADRLESNQMRQLKRASVLLFAVAAGLAPVALMGRSTVAVGYDSRFRVPILPVAAALTVFLFVQILPRAKVWISIAILGLIVGQTTVTFASRNVEETRMIDNLGSLLEGYAARTQDLTVAVVPIFRLQNELNAHVTSGWPESIEKRFWMYNAVTARYRFGDRGACSSNLIVNERIRPIERSGRVDQLLWVELQAGGRPIIEPYCLNGNEVK